MLQIINEPTAAALACRPRQEEQAYLGVRPGRQHFDVSVLEVGDGVFEVLSTSGDTLGSDDFDEVIVDHLAETFKSDEGIDLRRTSRLCGA